MTTRNCVRRMCLATALALLSESCYRPSYQPALYDGAERLIDGPYFEYQKSRTDCGVAAAVMMLRLNGREARYGTLRHEVTLSRDGLSLAQLRQLMLRNRLPVRGVKVDPSALDDAALPLIAWLPTHHVIVLEEITSASAVVSDPGRGRWKVSRARLSRAWDGTALVPVRAGSRVSLARMRSDTAPKHLTRGSYP